MASNYLNIFLILIAFMIISTVIVGIIWAFNLGHAEQVNHDFHKCVKMFDYRTCELFYPPLDFQKV